MGHSLGELGRIKENMGHSLGKNSENRVGICLPGYGGGGYTPVICLPATLGREPPSLHRRTAACRRPSTARVCVPFYTFSHRVVEERPPGEGKEALSPQE